MRSLEEIKDQVVNSRNFDNWQHFIQCWILYADYNHLLDEFIEQIAYDNAKQMCEKQRDLCANEFEESDFMRRKFILNTPLAIDNI